jgi:hypothetical protein
MIVCNASPHLTPALQRLPAVCTPFQDVVKNPRLLRRGAAVASSTSNVCVGQMLSATTHRDGQASGDDRPLEVVRVARRESGQAPKYA